MNGVVPNSKEKYGIARVSSRVYHFGLDDLLECCTFCDVVEQRLYVVVNFIVGFLNSVNMPRPFSCCVIEEGMHSFTFFKALGVTGRTA
jgi:hypothetical protein